MGVATGIVNWWRNKAPNVIANPVDEPDVTDRWLLTRLKNYGVEKFALFDNGCIRFDLSGHPCNHVVYCENLALIGSLFSVRSEGVTKLFLFLEKNRAGKEIQALIWHKPNNENELHLIFSQKQPKVSD